MAWPDEDWESPAERQGSFNAYMGRGGDNGGSVRPLRMVVVAEPAVMTEPDPDPEQLDFTDGADGRRAADRTAWQLEFARIHRASEDDPSMEMVLVRAACERRGRGVSGGHR